MSSNALSQLKFQGDEFEAKDYSDLVTSNVARGDERASTIEVIFDKPLDLKDKKFAAIVIPDVLADTGKTANAIRSTGMEIITYQYRRGSSWSNYVTEIYGLVEDFYRKSGKL